MRKILKFIMILSLISLIGYYGFLTYLKYKSNNLISNYMESTSVEVQEQVDSNINVSYDNKDNQNNKLQYTSILEIPSINLKEGLVDSTNNFSSIQYAVSIDKSSNYPDRSGNFILYAHSGNCYFSFFRNLNKVNLKDYVFIYFNGIKYNYEIIDKYDIKKSGKANIVSSNNERYITLITCDPDKEGYQIVLVGILKSTSLY